MWVEMEMIVFSVLILGMSETNSHSYYAREWRVETATQ